MQQRQIKFRGKARSGNWVYGYYTIDANGRHCIWTTGTAIEVDGDTIGHFTDLLDKNGKAIYEGNIVPCEDQTYTNEWV